MIPSKTTAEVRRYTWSFSTRTEILNGQTITSAGPTYITPNDGILTVGTPAVSSPNVQALVSGGVANTQYLLTQLAYLSDGVTVLANSGYLNVNVD